MRDASVGSVQSRGSSSGSESMVSFSEAEGAGVSGSALDVNAVEQTDFATASAPAPPSSIGEPQQSSGADLTRPRSRSSQLASSLPPEQHHLGLENGIHAATTLPRLKSDPRLGQDVPPVPEIPSTLSLHLPGTFPRDMSPKRRPSSLRTSKSVERRVSQSQPLQPQPQSQDILLRPSTAPSSGPVSGPAGNVAGTGSLQIPTPPQPAQTQFPIQETPAVSRSPATSTRLVSTSLSTREGRTSRRDKSRQTSSRHSGVEFAPSVGKSADSGSLKTRRVDLGRLLEGVKVDDYDEDEDGEGGGGNRFRGKGRSDEKRDKGGGEGVHIQPPY